MNLDLRTHFRRTQALRPGALAPILVLCLAPGRAAAQALLRYEIHGQTGFLAPIGDLDQDGAVDFLTLTLHAYSGRTGQELFAFEFDRFVEPNVVYLTSSDLAANLGDVTGDGVPDLVLCARLYSGADLLAAPPGPPGPLPAPLFDFAPPAQNLGAIGALAVLDDLNSDGLPELALGWPDVTVSRCGGDSIRTSQGPSGGAVRIYSGLDGSVLREDARPTAGTAMGGILARLGDVDGDGRSDYAVGTRVVSDSPYFCQETGGSFLEVHSGASGALLWQLPLAPRVVVGTADVNRDGCGDLALGYPFPGSFEVRSGKDGRLLRASNDPSGRLNLFGHALVAAGDLFGSGAPSLFVSAPQPFVFSAFSQGHAAGPGEVLLLSLARRSRPLVLGGFQEGEEFGADIAFLGDTDRDGRPEVAIGLGRGETSGLIRVLELDLYPTASDPVPIPGSPMGIH